MLLHELSLGCVSFQLMAVGENSKGFSRDQPKRGEIFLHDTVLHFWSQFQPYGLVGALPVGHRGVLLRKRPHVHQLDPKATNHHITITST